MKGLLRTIGFAVLALAAVFLAIQTALAAALAGMVSPALGNAVLVALLAIYAAIGTLCVRAYRRLPVALDPPADERAPEFEAHLAMVRTRLAENPRLAHTATHLDTREGIEEAIRILDAQAMEVAKRTASAVFVSTAISQNGRLDALMVLAMQARMLWQIAAVYRQRPTPREMWKLYANVAGTAFFAAQIDDIDIADQVQPVIQASLGSSVLGMVPGVSHVSSIVIQAVLEGSANAYLTLRVAAIGQKYCGAVVAVDRAAARRYASVTAAGILGSLVAESAGAVARAILGAAKSAGGAKVEEVASGIRGAVARMNPWRGEQGS